MYATWKSHKFLLDIGILSTDLGVKGNIGDYWSSSPGTRWPTAGDRLERDDALMQERKGNLDGGARPALYC